MGDRYTNEELEIFIREELQQHGEWLVDVFREALEKNGNVDTGRLLQSLNASPARTGSDGSVSVAINFETYGRLLEIRSRKLRQASSNRNAWGNRRRKTRKNAWYNKNRYKGLGRLVRTLSAGIDDEELKRIRDIIEQAQHDLMS